jgi:hypothetical protein
MPARALPACLAVAALCASAGVACAQGKPLDDKELSATWGQALLDLTNTDQGGYQFSRITLNADITMSSTLTGLKLGTYATNGVPGSDIDIGRMSFGRSDLDDAHRTVAITNPFFEWVYSGTANTADRQVVGMRLGFGGISGDVGLQMNTVSGSLAINTDGGLATLNGSRGTTLGGCASCTMPLSSVGGVTAGDASGASRDFFISLLKTALTFPATDAAVGAPAQSQAGFWLNWTDRLKAINTTGFVPPNVPKTGP